MDADKKCVSEVSPEVHFNLVRAESDAYLRSIAIQQEWNETAPALQLLFLPKTGPPPLPSYQPSPEYLEPSHCRLCLQPVSEDKDKLLAHLKSEHQIDSVQEYRHDVFLRTIAEWPQQISPQILRSRLAAFKKELSEENFKEIPCACCARLKRKC